MDTSDTQTVEASYLHVRAEAAALTAELAASVDGDTVDLPSLPDVVLKIRDALARDDVDLDRLAELAGADPALAARLMKIANSALFARGTNPPSTLHAAVVRLGSRMVRNTAIAIAAQQIFIGYSSEAIRPEIERIWRHSVHVAALCHLLLVVRRTLIAPEEGFLAGLLHEVGRLFILLRTQDHEALRAEPEALEAVIDEWQARVGARVVEAWEFPQGLADAVRDHDRCALACEAPITLTDVVAVANFLSMQSEASADLDELLANLPDFGDFNLDEDALRFVLDTARTEVDSLLSNIDGSGHVQENVASSA